MLFTAISLSKVNLKFVSFSTVLIVSLLFSQLSYSAPVVVVDENFDNGIGSGWITGSQQGGNLSVSTDISENNNNSAGSLKAYYPTPSTYGASYNWAAFNISQYNSYDVMIEFSAKMPRGKGGLKFLKVFSGNNGTYANTTFGLDNQSYPAGRATGFSFGDGADHSNDVKNLIYLNGEYKNWVGRSYGIATINTPQNSNFKSEMWGTDWHRFKIYMKFNSGTSAANEVPDGAYYLEIDGRIYIHATGIFNRNYQNMPIDRVEILGHAQSGREPFEIWYDDVKITVGASMPPMLIPERPINLGKN